MELYILFGLPGAGKTYIGNFLQTRFDFYFYEGDQEVSQDLKDAIAQERVTDRMRDDFFDRLIVQVNRLKKQHKKIVVSQTFIKEKYRRKFQNEFPESTFVYVETMNELREKRLMTRKDSFLTLEQWRKMAFLFEPPQIDHITIHNNHDGENDLRKQFTSLLHL